MKGKPQSFLTPKQLECQLFSNMTTQTSPNTLNFHSEKLAKLVEDLENKFPWNPVHPKEEITSIMYRAGQESVVQYIKQVLDEN